MTNEALLFDNDDDYLNSAVGSPLNSIVEKNEKSSDEKKSEGNAEFIALSFPLSSTASHYPSGVSPLSDPDSSFASVARICLGLSQYASSGCSATCGSYPMEDFGGEPSQAFVAQSCLFNEETVAKEVCGAIKSLTMCASSHNNPKCRILALKCLANLARSSYARLRYDPQLHSTAFAPPGSPASTVEDECAVDVPTTLCNVALTDTSDLVAANAFEALGTLCLDSRLDPLTHYINEVAFSQRPLEPLDYVQEPHSTMMIEFTFRILGNVVAKRLRQLVQRANSLRPSLLQLHTIPVLTFALNQFRTNSVQPSNIVPGMISVEQFAKRWFEVDILGLREEFARLILLPNLLEAADGRLAVGCAISLVRLASHRACTTSSWLVEGCSAACDVLLRPLERQTNADMAENTASTVAIAIAAAQVLPWDYRMNVLNRALSVISSLPAADTLSESFHKIAPVRPLRVGLLSECAVQILGIGGQSSVEALNMAISSPVLVASFRDRMHSFVQHGSNQDRIHFAEEVVVTFCQCAFHVGSKLKNASKKARKGVKVNTNQCLNHWLRCSIMLLSAFSPCLAWRFVVDQRAGSPSKLGCEAAGESYLNLLGLCLSVVGLLGPSSSISLSPEGKKAEQTTDDFLLFPWAAHDLISLMRQLLQYKLPEGIPCESTRIRLLGMISSHWANKCHREMRRAEESYEINELQETNDARSILRLIGSDIATILQRKGINSAPEELLSRCITSVELIALSACDKLQASISSSTALDHDACSDIIKISLDVLMLNFDREGPTMEMIDERALNRCRTAASRIKSNFERSRIMNGVSTSSFSAVPTWVFAASNDDEQSVLSAVSGAGLAVSQNNSGLSSFEGDGVISASALRRTMFWKCAQLTASARVSKVFALQNLLHNDGEPSSVELGSHDDRNTLLRPNKERNPIWLGVPEMTSSLSFVGASMCAQRGSFPFARWQNSVSTITGSSDPIVALLSYKTQNSSRHDGQIEPRLVVTIRVFNAMAVPVTRGLRLDLSVCHLRVPKEDPIFGEEPDVGQVLGTYASHTPLTYCSATYKGELKPYDCITWELELDIQCPGDILLETSVAFREVLSEEAHRRFHWVNGSPRADADTTDLSDDASAASGGASLEDTKDDGDEVMDASFACEPVLVPSIVMLLPCSLVFFAGESGEAAVFDVLWMNMRDLAQRIQLERNNKQGESDELTYGPAGRLLAQRSSLDSRFDSFSASNKAWAFMDWSGRRLLCVFNVVKTEGSANLETNSVAFLEVRSDDKMLLRSLIGSPQCSSRFISDLTQGLWQPCELSPGSSFGQSDDLVAL